MFQSKASLIVEVTGDWNFDYTVEKLDTDLGSSYNVSNTGIIGDVSVENHGGIKTTLKQVELQRKGRMRRYKTVVILAKRGTSDPPLGLQTTTQSTTLGLPVSVLVFSGIMVDPGQSFSLYLSQNRLLEHLSKGKLFVEQSPVPTYRLLMKHTFGKGKSTQFHIKASQSTLDYLGAGMGSQQFYERSHPVT
jgi:hypothetical protein